MNIYKYMRLIVAEVQSYPVNRDANFGLINTNK